MTVAVVSRPSPRAYIPVVVGWMLLLAGAFVFLRTDDLTAVLPDRAKLQGLVGLPLVLAAPGVMSVGWHPPTMVATARSVYAAAAAIAVFLAVALMNSIAQIGCRPVTSPIEALPQSAFLAAIPAIGFALAARAARPKALATLGVARSIIIGVIVGLGALALDLAAFAVLFPPVSCAPIG